MEPGNYFNPEMFEPRLIFFQCVTVYLIRHHIFNVMQYKPNIPVFHLSIIPTFSALRHFITTDDVPVCINDPQ
jgi:hypothetical protein